jgi:transmembrane sensor
LRVIRYKSRKLKFMTNELLVKYIIGQTNQKETEDVLNWVKVSEEREEEIAQLKNIWIMTGLENEVDPLLKNNEIERILKIINEFDLTREKKINFAKILQYAAGILLIVGLSASAGYFFSQKSIVSDQKYTEIYVPKGERSSVHLPDGSVVQLNSDSRLRFISTLNHLGKRRVSLSGEGFFDVKHDSLHPFIVETSNFEIEVLGTSFDVSCYPNDSLNTTFLQKGKVKINQDNTDAIILKPNELYQYDKTTMHSNKKKIQDHRYLDWTQGRFTIRGETIGELAKKLERRYNINIVFGDAESKNHMYSGTIKDGDLNTVLDALTYASTIKFEHRGNTIILYSKK